MSAVTLEQIKAEQSRLAELIANYEAAAKRALVVPEAYIELQPGERYAGLLLNDDGKPAHHVVLLAGEAEKKTWGDAIAWATSQGGELPTRREQSLLFANLKSEFKEAWYWSQESHADDGAYAWFQFFNYGLQNFGPKSYEGRCRAVRRVTT